VVGVAGDNKDLIRYLTAEVVNGGDLARIVDLFSADYVLHKPGMSFPIGPEAFKMSTRDWRNAFPDYRVTILELFGEGDLVASLFVATGTHRGALLGMPPTDKPFTVTGTDVHRVVDGVIVESWLADDLPRILTEAGVMKPLNAESGRWT
jgi:predicted ester cyclase